MGKELAAVIPILMQWMDRGPAARQQQQQQKHDMVLPTVDNFAIHNFSVA